MADIFWDFTFSGDAHSGVAATSCQTYGLCSKAQNNQKSKLWDGAHLQLPDEDHRALWEVKHT